MNGQTNESPEETNAANQGPAVVTDDENSQPQRKRFQKAPWVIGCSAWCRKFFWEGKLQPHKLGDKYL